MGKLLNKYPIVAIALILLACIRFEYRWNNGSTLGAPGLGAGVVVLGIVMVVLLYRIFNAVQDGLIAAGKLAARIRCKYDVLIPIAIIASAIHCRWVGKQIVGMFGQQIHQWEFQWSEQSYLPAYFIIAIVFTVLLLRILQLIQQVSSHADTKAGRTPTAHA